MPNVLTQLLLPAMLIATRISGLMVTAPFLGSSTIPMRIKAGLVLAMTILLYPLAARPLGNQPILAWIASGVSEFTIGALLGMVLNFVFEAVQMAGSITGFQLGFSLVNLIDPTSNINTSVMAAFHTMVMTYVFLQLGGHLWILRGLGESFARLPLGTPLNREVGAGLLHFSGLIFSFGLQLALPVLVVTMLTDVTLGFVAKAAPQMPVLIMGFPLKSMLGYTVLIGVVSFWPHLLASHLGLAFQGADRMLVGR